MTHPDTLQIPRAVVEQALEALVHSRSVLNHNNLALQCLPVNTAITALRAAQPAVVHPIGGRPLESDYVKLTSYIEALEQYVDKKEVLWKAYEDVDCDEYDRLRKAALQSQATVEPVVHRIGSWGHCAMGEANADIEALRTANAKPRANIEKTGAMHTAVRNALMHHKLTSRPDGVIESDLIYAVLDCIKGEQG